MTPRASPAAIARTSNLPEVQQQLLEAVAKTGKPVAVVLLNGSALAVNWAQQNARALLEAWYPGQSGGQAIAETLSGKNNPAGRLPVTFYKGVDQLPAFDDYSMANRTYRYFKGKPLYAFGDGLSYTTFAYSGLKLSTTDLKAGETLTVEADVKNTGHSPAMKSQSSISSRPNPRSRPEASPCRIRALPPQSRRDRSTSASASIPAPFLKSMRKEPAP